MAEARVNLEKAFARDPYHVWIKNTLDLLDTFSRYTIEKSPRFEVMLERFALSKLALKI
mgnify:CR=1 FL=1